MVILQAGSSLMSKSQISKQLCHFLKTEDEEAKSHNLLGSENLTRLFTSHLLALPFHFLLFCIQICWFSSFLSTLI